MIQSEYLSKAGKMRGLMLVLAGLVSALVVWGSNSYKATCQNGLFQARSSLSDARENYRRAVDAGDILNTSQQHYQRLRMRGFIGEEPRLLWIEALRDIGQQHHLYNLQYKLGQRQELQSAEGDAAEHYQAYVSPMHLDLELAHEVDLLRYFADLDRDRPGVYQVRDCTLSALFNDNEVTLDKPNISASCNLAWFTVKPFSGSDADGEIQ